MTIVILRGYPASGKTTYAKGWVRTHENVVRVSRDDLRQTVFAADGVLPYDQEQLITKIQRGQVATLVKAGKSVIIDDTNLRLKYARAWADLAFDLGTDHIVVDITTPANECEFRDVERQASGGRYVGWRVIQDMAQKFPISQWQAIEPTAKRAAPIFTPYDGTPGKPDAWIVDIDGTVADHMFEGGRGHHEYHRVSEDRPIEKVISLVWGFWGRNADIIYVSGRKDSCRQDTEDWLSDKALPLGPLYMRKSDDNRNDAIVKNEIFENEIKDRYNVLGCVDDRDRVVAMWRAKGILCLQVADGNF